MKSYIKDYPRPQLVRNSWQSLNGKWSFAFDKDNNGEEQKWYQGFEPQHQINVPFTYETVLSGINIQEAYEAVWYSREIEIENFDKDVIIHFEGSDYITNLWVNGNHVGSHKGGYSRFSFDITRFLVKGKNTVTVKVLDSQDTAQPRGKQRWLDENFGCWYVQTTGIWKTVWLEFVPKTRIKSIKITPKLAEQRIKIIAEIEGKVNGDASIVAEASFGNISVGKSTAQIKGNSACFEVDVTSKQVDEWGIKKWSPESPNLYDLKLTLEGENGAMDEIMSYFGMREIEIYGNKILLNGRPLYQRLILDQGYWKDSHLTPPSEEAIIEDIDKVMALGYNGVRKHMKVEDERFLYWADVKGLLVWSECAATYTYNDNAVENFTNEWIEIVRQNYNHPSIITWTPFNESWGVPAIFNDKAQQDFTKSIYYLTKAMDSMRPVICNDGWEHTISDIITLHDYEETGEKFLERYLDMGGITENIISHNLDKYAMAKGCEYKGQPIIISEFGGIAFNSGESGWGYGNKVAGEAEFLARFKSITSAIKSLHYCVGYCYTQVSDVQQEINGLMDEERNFKIAPEKIREINME